MNKSLGVYEMLLGAGLSSNPDQSPLQNGVILDSVRECLRSLFDRPCSLFDGPICKTH